MPYYNSAKEFFKETGLDLDDMIETEVAAGKHDVTHHYGYIPIPNSPYYYSIWYSISYNNGIEYIEMDTRYKFTAEEETKVVIVYKKV